MDTVNPLTENKPSTRQKRLPSSSSKLEFAENKKEKFLFSKRRLVRFSFGLGLSLTVIALIVVVIVVWFRPSQNLNNCWKKRENTMLFSRRNSTHWPGALFEEASVWVLKVSSLYDCIQTWRNFVRGSKVLSSLWFPSRGHENTLMLVLLSTMSYKLAF